MTSLPAYALSLGGNALELETCRLSAMPFNRVWTGRQRTLDQTKLGSFVAFDLERPETLKIEGVPREAPVTLYPMGEADRLSRCGETLLLRLDHPSQYVVTFGDALPDLHIFANPPFHHEHVPNEIYFGPGVHEVGVIAPTNGQTVCFDSGATVYGALFLNSVTNVSVVGRGILDNSRFTRSDPRARAFRVSHGLPPEDAGFGCHACVVYRSENVRLEGFVIRDTPLWAVVVRSGSRKVTLDNLKIIGQWRYNSDGYDICASSDVVVKNCFVRSFDDCLVVLGAYLDTRSYVSENVRFENCRCWCDWGATFKIWSPPHTNTVRNVTVRNCAFLHNQATPIQIKDSCASANTRIENIVFDGVEMDFAEMPLKSVIQKTDAMKYPGDRHVGKVVCGLHQCGWPRVDHGNQKFVRIEHPTGIHSLIDGVTYRNFTFPGMVPTNLTAYFETNVKDQFIRGVRYEGMPPMAVETHGEGIEIPDFTKGVTGWHRSQARPSPVWQ